MTTFTANNRTQAQVSTLRWGDLTPVAVTTPHRAPGVSEALEAVLGDVWVAMAGVRGALRGALQSVGA